MGLLLQNFPLVKQGADFFASLPLTSSSYSPSDVTFICSISRFPGGPILAEVQTSWDGSVLYFFMPNEVTKKLPPTGLLGSPNSTPWVYDLVVIFSDASRMCLSEGKVYVDPAITTP